jgi:hypothetical protein
MRRPLSLLHFAAIAALTAAMPPCAALADAPSAPAAPDPDAAYQALLAKAQADPDAADWQAVRFAYAARPAFHVFAQSAAKRTMFEAAGRSDCAAALPAALAVIAESYVDADAHMVAAFCEDAKGDAATAARDRAVGRALIKSIETGDGLSPATAFTVIDVDEEYALIRALGLHIIQQALIHAGGHAYDQLSVIDDKGHASSYYFLIDRVLAAEAAELTPGAVSEGGPPGRSP